MSSSQDPGVAGVVLAAGASTRLGQPKQLLRADAGETRGEPLVVVAARQLLDAGCAPVLVVTGGAHDDVARAVDPLGVSVLFNDAWREGMGASIRAAMQWMARQDAQIAGTVIAACDMPSVTAGHIRALMERSANGQLRVASSYEAPDGQVIRGIPALLPRADWPALSALVGDRGARALLQAADTHVVHLERGSFDLDTPEDVRRWRAAATNRE
jgi:molybdenum cofactor cytidylyltransferase